MKITERLTTNTNKTKEKELVKEKKCLEKKTRRIIKNKQTTINNI